MTVRVVLPPHVLPGYEIFYLGRGERAENRDWRSKLLRSLPVIKKNLKEYPKIKFTKLDGVLQRQFYQISFSTIRRKLWLSSKQTSNFGKKPRTCLVDRFFYFGGYPYDDEPELDSYKRKVLKTYDNIVFYVEGRVELKDSADLRKILKFIEFDVGKIELRNFACLPEYFETIMTPNVEVANIAFCNFEMKTVLDLMPNLNFLYLQTTPECDWEDLFDYDNPWWVLYINTKKIKNWKKCWEFLKRQKKDTQIFIEDLEHFDKEEILKYFTIVKCLDGNIPSNKPSIHCSPHHRLHCKQR
uniref:DUF38 domain-containing protein n=1 Tax=Panagrolaimus sp. JU765 TaxID=591449 RepID=A0AC34QAP6_9BILA